MDLVRSFVGLGPSEPKRLRRDTSRTTLRHYLTPTREFHDAEFPEITVHNPVTLSPTRRKPQNNKCTSTATSPFDPGPRLDRNRLPYHVQLVDNMHDLMFRHFSELLDNHELATERVASPGICAAYRATRDFCRGHRLTGEASVKNVAIHIADPVREAYRDLTGEASITFADEVNTEDRAVRTDHIYCRTVDDDEEGDGNGEEVQEPVVLWESKNPYAFNRHLKTIQARLKAGYTFPLHQSVDKENQPSEKWVHGEAILCKLAWHATDLCNLNSPHNSLHWALVFGGNKYIVIFIAYTKESKRIDGSTICHFRPALYCSPILEAHNSRFPIISTVLYMVLTSRLTQTELCDKLQIAQVPVPSPPICRPIGQITECSRPSSSVLETASRIITETSVTKGDGYMLTRTILGPKTTSPKFYSGTAALMLDLDYFIGGGGIVYLTIPRGFVIKCSYPNDRSREHIRQEASVYKSIIAKPPCARTPTYYGEFTFSNCYAIVISDEGQQLDSFEGLSPTQQNDLLDKLEQLHHVGILHGDFRYQNVVVGAEGLVIIDFSHATLGHACAGREECRELIGAQKDLLEAYHAHSDTSLHEHTDSTHSTMPEDTRTDSYGGQICTHPLGLSPITRLSTLFEVLAITLVLCAFVLIRGSREGV